MVRKSKGLTERQINILKFLVSYQNNNGRPPTLHEIGDGAKISSTATVNYNLEVLEKMGYIERDSRVSRGIRLTDKVSEVVQIVSDLVRVPILGRIVASEPAPVPAADFNYYDAETSIEIASSLLPAPEKNKQLFALEVDGDSMIDAMVGDGDYVVMEPVFSNSEVHDGDMVAIWLPNQDEVTLKYFYDVTDYYWLQPANPTMEPIIIDKSEPVEIKGKVLLSINMHTDRREMFTNTSSTETNISKFILWNKNNPNRPLTPAVLEKEILPFLNAIETIQETFNLINGTKSYIKIHSITQHSPESITFEGVIKAIEFIVNRVDPLRKELAERNMKSMDADIFLKNAQAASIILDNQKKVLDNQKKSIENAKERINILIETLDIHNEKLTDDLRDQFREAITEIVASDLRLALKDNSLSKTNTGKYSY